MKHPKEESWSDYVRGAADVETTRRLEEHLGTGCAECGVQVQALQAVSRVAETDRELEVPVSAVRAARNLFRVQRLLEQGSKSRLSLGLSFDSLLAPAAVGVRGEATGDRHLVYKSPEMTLDLQLQLGGSPDDMQVVGQVLDSNSAPIADVPAFLLQGGRISSQDLSGGMGEFKLFCDAMTAPRLCLLIGDEQLVDLEIPSSKEDTN